jgi:hypothetical protein
LCRAVRNSSIKSFKAGEQSPSGTFKHCSAHWALRWYVNGSHRIYFHARTGRPFPIQPDGQDAKHYQVWQLRDMIRKHGLTLDESE